MKQKFKVGDKVRLAVKLDKVRINNYFWPGMTKKIIDDWTDKEVTVKEYKNKYYIRPVESYIKHCCPEEWLELVPQEKKERKFNPGDKVSLKVTYKDIINSGVYQAKQIYHDWHDRRRVIISYSDLYKDHIIPYNGYLCPESWLQKVSSPEERRMRKKFNPKSGTRVELRKKQLSSTGKYKKVWNQFGKILEHNGDGSFSVLFDNGVKVLNVAKAHLQPVTEKVEKPVEKKPAPKKKIAKKVNQTFTKLDVGKNIEELKEEIETKKALLKDEKAKLEYLNKLEQEECDILEYRIYAALENVAKQHGDDRVAQARVLTKIVNNNIS